MTETRKWSLLAVLLVAAIFAASWFLLIAPKRSEAQDLQGQAVAQLDKNQRLRQKLEQLKAQSLELPKQQALLANMRRQIPDNPALPALIRDLSEAAKKSGVNLVSLAPSDPVAVTLPAAPPVAAETTDTESSGTTSGTAETGTTESGTAETGTAAGTTGAAAAPTTPQQVLFQVPVVVKVEGGYFEMEQFINKLEALKRSFLVAGFLLKSVEGAGAAGAGSTVGTTTATPGQLQLDIQGQVFLSPETLPAAAATPAPTPATTAAPTS